jgi:hypothetical protein
MRKPLRTTAPALTPRAASGVQGWREERRDAALAGAVAFGQIYAKSAAEFVMMMLAPM